MSPTPLIVETKGEPEISQLMLAGVRLSGTPFLTTRFRWGYGWPFFRGYQITSDEERTQIEELSAPNIITVDSFF